MSLPISHSHILILSLLLLTLAGCAASTAIDTSKPIDPREVMRLVEERNTEVRALRGTGKISVESPEFSGGGSIQVNALKPDSLQLEITAAFGVTVARGMLTGESFQFYNGMNNTVTEGNSTVDNLRRILRFPIAFSTILDVVTGTLGFEAAPRDIPPIGILKDNDYVLAWTSEGQSHEYTVDLGTMAVRYYTRRNERGEILEEIHFRDYRRHAGIALPHIINISRPFDSENLSVVYDRMMVNDFPVRFNFSYPRSARRITL
ncbi:MAG: DUF4292 domain-containing protein [Bacteroidetes bacterium]|nr:DUF4292 domain-containing protein [Bacteroidota bacterium]